MTALRDSYFVTGDKRSPGGSLDSRAFGPVDAWDILAQAVLSVWPLPRKACAVPPCDSGPTPEESVQFSGPEESKPCLLLP